MVLAEHVTEKALRQQVLDLARLVCWLVYFTWSSIHSPAGFPDLVLIRGGRVVFAELKSDKGKLSEHQRRWLLALAEAGAEVYVWKPGDWVQIERVLR